MKQSVTYQDLIEYLTKLDNNVHFQGENTNFSDNPLTLNFGYPLVKNADEDKILEVEVLCVAPNYAIDSLGQLNAWLYQTFPEEHMFKPNSPIIEFYSNDTHLIPGRISILEDCEPRKDEEKVIQLRPKDLEKRLIQTVFYPNSKIAKEAAESGKHVYAIPLSGVPQLYSQEERIRLVKSN